MMKSLMFKIFALSAFLILGISMGLADDAAALYQAKCQVCHGADGNGNTAVGKKHGVPDFHSPEVAKMSDVELFDITKNGKNKMPAYKSKLTEDQIKSLIKYIRLLM